MDHPLPKTRKGRERREQILDAAMEAFAVQGSRNVSLASLAPAIGISEQGLMHYFPTKVHLVLGVLERREARETARHTALAQTGLPLFPLLLEIMRSNVAEPQLSTLHSVLMAESVDPGHPAHAWFAASNERTREHLAAGLAQVQQDGEMRRDLDPDAVAAHILALFNGLATQRALAAGQLDIVSIFEQYLRSLAPEGTHRALEEVRSARAARGAA